MRPGLALIVAGVAAWMPPAALTAAGPATITVRVYQTAGLTPTVEQRALEGAGAALRPALVEVRWRICTGPNRSTACDLRPGPSELSLRIVPQGSPDWNASITLGTAFVAPRTGGVLATVYSITSSGWHGPRARMSRCCSAARPRTNWDTCSCARRPIRAVA